MASTIELFAGDGHQFTAYRSTPENPRGGLVVLQEIFGVNSHIRALVDGFAADGYDTIAPALFDRIEPSIELGYSDDDVTSGRDLRTGLAFDDVMLDVAAACDAVAGSGKTGAIGYCWGGTLTWLAATRLNVAYAIGYYGSMTADFIDETPVCPVTLMVGESDTTFPPEKIEAIATRHPATVIFTYPAGHGFACDQRGSWDEASARQARERSLDVLLRYVG